MNRRLALAAVVALLTVAAPTSAHAFCGFYIAGPGAEMFNNATQVVLMRRGTRTVLAMQNNYQGPAKDFAMVVPVPVVLHEEDVKTLPRDVFARVEVLGSPRLVEYWERDPCDVGDLDLWHTRPEGMSVDARMFSGGGGGGGYGVTVEAEFVVGEYQIVILSATESTGLDAWLRAQSYQIPAGAEPLLRPYVEAGSKFFVAKVDPTKVRFEDGMAMLSPLRFHYDSEELVLPVRLGLANSAGTQDLLINIIAADRYEVANYPNVTIPTNLEVTNEVRSRFGEFYAALFDRTVELNPGAVVTEYAWQASSCDPCAGPPLSAEDYASLGGDLIEQIDDDSGGSPVLTRLHARYGADDLEEDLVFKKAQPIVGGREFTGDYEGQLEWGATVSSHNNFQGRYAIRHRWTGPIECDTPQRDRWGGPPDGESSTMAATNLAFAPRGKVALASLVAEDIPELKIVAAHPRPGQVAAKARGCGCASSGDGAAATGLGMLGLVLLGLRPRRRG